MGFPISCKLVHLVVLGHLLPLWTTFVIKKKKRYVSFFAQIETKSAKGISRNVYRVAGKRGHVTRAWKCVL